MRYDIYTTEEMNKRFDELPIDVQNTLTSDDFERELRSIAANNKIDGEKVKNLIALVTGVLMAVNPIKGFIARITEHLAVSPEVAKKIAGDINEAIFRPIRKSIIFIHEIPTTEQAEIPETETHPEHMLKSGPVTVKIVDVKPFTPLQQSIKTATTGAKPAEAPLAPFKTLRNDIAVAQNAGAFAQPEQSDVSIYEQKMAGPTSLAPQKKTVDPYREAID